MRWLRGGFTVLVLATMGVFVGPVRPACACSCAMVTSEESLDQAEMAFVGVVTRIDRPVFGGYTGQPLKVTLAVSEVYKGRDVVTERFEVTTASDGAACGYDFVEGRRYLVFASTWEGTVNTGLCSGNRDLALESNPYASGSFPRPGGPSGWWTTTATVAASAGIVAVLSLGIALWFWRRRRGHRRGDLRDHEVKEIK
jgi:hypothetical protein